MIICPKCSADNQIGAIFCRGCGEKLDLDELKPAAVQKAAQALNKRAFNTIGLIKNLIGLVILVAVIGVLIGLFLTPPVPAQTSNPAAADQEMVTAQERLQEFRDQQQDYVKASFDDLPYFAAQLLGLSAEDLAKNAKRDVEEGQIGMRLTAFYVEVLESGEENRLRFTIKEEFNKWPMVRYYKVVEGRLTASDSGLAFKPLSVRMGRWAMGFSDFTQTRVLEDFRRAIEGKAELQDLIKECRRIEWKEDEVRFYRTAKSEAPVKKKKKKKDAE